MTYEHTLDHLLDDLGCFDLLLSERRGSRREVAAEVDLTERLCGTSDRSASSTTEFVVPESVRAELERHRDRIAHRWSQLGGNRRRSTRKRS